EPDGLCGGQRSDQGEGDVAAVRDAELEARELLDVEDGDFDKVAGAERQVTVVLRRRRLAQELAVQVAGADRRDGGGRRRQAITRAITIARAIRCCGGESGRCRRRAPRGLGRPAADPGARGQRQPRSHHAKCEKTPPQQQWSSGSSLSAVGITGRTGLRGRLHHWTYEIRGRRLARRDAYPDPG